MTDYRQAQRALAALQRRNVTILGWGPDGAAHAMCLRDSGVDVRIGLPEGDPDRGAAEAEGFAVKESYEACEEADLVMLLAPAEKQAALYESALADNLVRGDVFLVGDGFALRHGLIEVPDGVDVGLVAPVGPGPLVRREFAEGRGVPVLVAVASDASGQAWDATLGYAAGIGGLRSGIVTTTIAEAVDSAAFGAAAVTLGGIPALMRAAVDTLTDAGYGAEVSYLACLHAAKAAVDIAWSRGLDTLAAESPSWHGFAAAHRGETSPVEREEMAELLEEISTGDLGAEFMADTDAAAAKAWRQTTVEHPSTEAGRALRAMMPWLVRETDPRTGERWR